MTSTVRLLMLATVVIALPAHAAERLTAGEWQVTARKKEEDRGLTNHS